MPIEIKELIIRATIDSGTVSKKGTALTGGKEDIERVNRLKERVAELQKMINQKNER